MAKKNKQDAEINQGSKEEVSGVLINTAESLYGSLSDRESHIKAQMLIKYTDWFNSVMEHDPFSDNLLDTDTDRLLENMGEESLDPYALIEDRIYHLVDFTSKEVDYLLKNMREKIVREHKNLPLYAIRETDSKCLQNLSLRPGRTLKQKLAYSNHMLGVKRRFSTDTLENQLLKFFLLRLSEKLILRRDCFKEAGFVADDKASDLITKISYWKNTDEAKEIGRWQNNPPNNVLLQDRNYRKIWLAFNTLRGLDEDIVTDSRNVDSHLAKYLFWNILLCMNCQKDVRIVQRPIKFKKNDFLGSYSLEAFIKTEDLDEFKEVILEVLDNRIIIDFNGNSSEIYFNDSAICFGDGNSIPNFDFDSLQAFPEQIVKIVFGKTNIEKYTKPYESATDCEKVGFNFSYAFPRVFLGNETKSLPFRLMVQKWRNNETASDVHNLLNSTSKAICLADDDYDIETFSLQSLIYREEDSDSSKKHELREASNFIAQSLAKYTNASHALYAVPDLLDDFNAEPLRSGMNSAFNYAKPIPVSIATSICALADGTLSCLEPRDLLIVADTTPKGFSLTPIYCDYNHELKNKIPQTRGIQFIRYPTEEDYGLRINKIMEELDIPKEISDKLSKLYDVDGITRDFGRTSFLSKNYVCHSITGREEALNYKAYLKEKNIKTVLKNLESRLKYKKVVILSVKSIIDTSELKDFVCIDGINKTAEGACIVHDYERQLGTTALWYDYLPELYMEMVAGGRKHLVNLVKNKKVNPKLKVSVPIKIDGTVGIPAGKNFCHFPLIQGIGKNKTDYEAFLKTNDFPFKEERECTLDLNYTYGDENPYKLAFIDCETKKRYEVEWKFKSEIPEDLSSLPIPPYPQIRDEYYYRHYPSAKGKAGKESDLIEWFERNLDFMMKLRFISEPHVKRTNVKGDGTCVVHFVDLNENIHASTNYPSEEKAANDVKQIEGCSLDSVPKTQKNAFKSLYYSQEQYDQGRNFNFAFPPNKLRAKMRFPVIALFNDGLKLSNFNSDLQRRGQSFIEYISNVLPKIGDKPNYFILEALNIICSMSDEIPQFVRELFENGYIDKLWNADNSAIVNRLYAVSIQECSTPWQKELLQTTLKAISKKKFFGVDVLANAVWRNRELIKSFNAEMLSKIAELNLETMKEQLKNIKEDSSKGKSKAWRIKFIAKGLELTLGLMRSRESDNEDIKRILAPDQKLNTNYLSFLTELIEYVEKNRIEIKSFLKIEIDDDSINVSDRNSNFLLKAVEKFMRAENISGSIRIIGLEVPTD